MSEADETVLVEHEGKPLHALDALSAFSANKSAGDVPYHNTDFLWPTLTYLGSHLHRHGRGETAA